MPRFCAVPGCQSGRHEDRRRRKKLNLRQLSIFSIPKCADKRQEWARVLGCDLNTNQFVCQLHFAEQSIRKSDKTKLPDGTVHEIPRDYWYLENNAMPITINNTTVDLEEDINVNKGEMEGSNGEITSADEATEKPVSHHETSVENISANTKTCNPIRSTFSGSILKEQLEAALLPESYAWSRTSTGVVFTLLNNSNYHPQLHVEVSFDLSVQIRSITDTVTQMHDPLTSMEHLRTLLTTFKKYTICSGTGIERKSRHHRCIGILNDNDAYERWPQNPRCTLCRHLRAKLQRNNRSRENEMNKLNRTRKTIKLARRQFLRLKQK